MGDYFTRSTKSKLSLGRELHNDSSLFSFPPLMRMEDLPMYYLHKNGEILPYPPENPEEVDINRFLLQISLEEDGSLNFGSLSSVTQRHLARPQRGQRNSELYNNEKIAVL